MSLAESKIASIDGSYITPINPHPIIDKSMVTLEWVASPINDMYADAVLCAVLQSESMEVPTYIPGTYQIIN